MSNLLYKIKVIRFELAVADLIDLVIRYVQYIILHILK